MGLKQDKFNFDFGLDSLLGRHTGLPLKLIAGYLRALKLIPVGIFCDC
jgi:hypothetical protein